MSYKQFLDSDIDEIIERLGDTVHDFAGKRVLIAGACGFLGRYFLEVFSRLNENVLKEPAIVTGVDNFITGDDNYTKYKGNNIEVVQHSATDPYETPDSYDYLIHSASIASPFYYRANPLQTLDVAVAGSRWMLNLANVSRGRFVFFSSSEIYGDPDPVHVPTPESYRGHVACQGPRACYDESKRLGETLCYIYHDKFGTHTNTIRPFNVYGPGMGEKDYRVMPNFASAIIGDRPLNVYGDGNQTRTFCYITDAITGMFLVFLKGVPGEAYNIGNRTPEVSMLDLATLFVSASGKEVPINVVEHPDSYPQDEPQRRCPNIRKANLQLGFEPQVELVEGLRRYYEWAKDIYTGVQ